MRRCELPAFVAVLSVVGLVIPSLQGIRAIAVLAVIVYHAAFTNSPLGTIGVLTFFVLSGFLITWLLLQEREKTGSVSLKGFYLRRALRIFPAFYAVFLVTLVATKFDASREAILATALYVSNYTYPLFGIHIDLLDHAWSLAVEEQFYLMWPLAFVVVGTRHAAKFLAITIVAVWLWRGWMVFHGTDRYIYHAFDMRADHLLTGCLLAVLVKQGVITPAVSRFWPLALVIALASFTTDAFSLRYRDGIGFAIEPMCVAFLLITSVWRKTPFLNWKPIAYLGTISYGLYLWHPLTFSVVRHVLHRPKGVLQFVVGLVATVLVSAVSFKFYEAPILALKDRLGRRAAHAPSVHLRKARAGFAGRSEVQTVMK